MKIIKQELEFEECLKQRLEFIYEFSNVTPTFINGSITKLDKTNLTYIEPHRVIIKNITFLVLIIPIMCIFQISTIGFKKLFNAGYLSKILKMT